MSKIADALRHLGRAMNSGTTPTGSSLVDILKSMGSTTTGETISGRGLVDVIGNIASNWHEQPVPSVLVPFSVGQKINGYQFDTSVSDSTIASVIDNARTKTYSGLNQSDNTIGVNGVYVSTVAEGYWNGYAIGTDAAGSMGTITAGNTLYVYKCNPDVDMNTMKYYFSDLSYDENNVATLVDTASDGQLKVYRAANEMADFDYFVYVTDNSIENGPKFKIIYATGTSVTIDDAEFTLSAAGWVYQSTCVIGTYSATVANVQSNNKLVIRTEESDSIRYYVIYRTDGDDDNITVLYSNLPLPGSSQAGWQNLSPDNVSALNYNEYLTYFDSSILGFNGVIGGSYLVEASSYDVTINATNCNVSYTGPAKILEHGIFCFSVTPEAGYSLPESYEVLNATGATLTGGVGYITSPTGDPTINIAGVPATSSYDMLICATSGSGFGKDGYEIANFSATSTDTLWGCVENIDNISNNHIQMTYEWDSHDQIGVFSGLIGEGDTAGTLYLCVDTDGFMWVGTEENVDIDNTSFQLYKVIDTPISLNAIEATSTVNALQFDTTKTAGEVATLLTNVFGDIGNESAQIIVDNDIAKNGYVKISHKMDFWTIDVDVATDQEVTVYSEEAQPDADPEYNLLAGWNNLDATGKIYTNTCTVGTVNESTGWNGVLMGSAFVAEPLTPFEVGQTISGIDFGNVQNEDMSTDLDNFLSNLAGQYTSEGALPLVTLPDENYLAAVDMSQFSGSGYAIILGDQVVYATNANPEGDVRTTAGFQNLTDGKCLLSGAVSVSEVNSTISVPWNGVLIGAVESSPALGD